MFVFKGFLIEHRFSKPRVRGSNPLGRANSRAHTQGLTHSWHNAS